MSNGMIQAEIREKWSRHPPLLTAAAFYHPIPWVLPHPALSCECGAVAAVSHRQALGCWGQAGGDGDSQGCPSPRAECTAHLQHIIPPSLHPRKSFTHGEEHPPLGHGRVIRAGISGTLRSSEQPLGPKSPFPSLPPPQPARVALITQHHTRGRLATQRGNRAGMESIC